VEEAAAKFEDLPASGGSISPSSRSFRPLRICVASKDIAGPFHCGGVGTAYQGLALALAGVGHDVTVLYTHEAIRGGEERWREAYEQHGIRFVHAPQPRPAPLWYSHRKEASFACYRELVARGPFDVVHFHEWLGLPYYSLLAKRQGLAFGATTLCVGAHGPLRWSRAGEKRLPSTRDDLIIDYMERLSVELADVVISPSRYMLEWMRDDGWDLPERSYVAQNLLNLPGNLTETSQGAPAAPAIRELVFFGRLDRRKGVVFFCDVLDRIAENAPADLAVTFLGSAVMLDEPSDAAVRRRAARWPFSVTIETNADRDQALAYLRKPGRLAVMPALADNLPCTVHECALAGIPFLATDVGGTAEIVESGARSLALAPPEIEAFTERLRAIFASGQQAVTPRVPASEAARRWVAWHGSLGACDPESAKDLESAVTRPVASVSVCLAHYERPRELAIMIDSLRAQTQTGFELVVVDDGSPSEAARVALAALEPEIVRRGGAVLRIENSGPGAARHAAAERARGECLLFVDDDDFLEPRALATLVGVAERTGADALVSAYRRFQGDGAPPVDTHAADAHGANAGIPLGPALAAALVYPELGGTVIFVRRDAYFACGGFPRDRNVDEDWELLLSLVESGYELQVIPEVLFWYRERDVSRSRADNRFARNLSRIRKYERMLPFELRDLAALAYGRLGGASDEDAERRVERVRTVLERAAKRRGTPTEES
jgi:glycosyltransferase involved in cell wall biosynthesis